MSTHVYSPEKAELIRLYTQVSWRKARLVPQRPSEAARWGLLGCNRERCGCT